VDRKSGKITVHDFWLVLDPGIAVQPDNVIAQTESSIIYGLGLSLTSASASRTRGAGEHIRDYGVPRLEDIPDCSLSCCRRRTGRPVRDRWGRRRSCRR